MIPVSTKFKNAQNADSNLPVSKVELLLGNYANAAAYGTTAASSGDFSADYPASGAIDGDRTEINCGPASAAPASAEARTDRDWLRQATARYAAALRATDADTLAAAFA